MELFLKNVPVDLSDDDLKRELIPHMNMLNILDWSSDKPKKRSQAWLSFLSEADGASFLAKHGKVSGAMPWPQHKHNGKESYSPAFVGKPRDIARLHILRTAVYVEKSNRQVDHLMLSHLRLEKDERETGRRRAAPMETRTCGVLGVACGKLVFGTESKELVFAQQTAFNPGGYASFKQRLLTLETSTCSQVHISYEIVESVIADSQDASLTLVLTEPPKFYSFSNYMADPRTPWSRMPAMTEWKDHAKYVGQCLVYRIRTTNVDFNKFVAAIKAQGTLTVTTDRVPVDPRPRPKLHDYTTCMAIFDTKLCQLGSTCKPLAFCLLFQVQALVWNNYVHPKTGTTMLEIMEKLGLEAEMKGTSPPFTTDTMKHLFQTIPFPYTGMEPEELDPFELLGKISDKEIALRADDPRRLPVFGERISDQQAWILKATVSPTRITLSGPDAESKNRVLRMFPDRTDHFLRVNFCDENGQDLAYNPKVSNEYIYNSFRNVLKEGIEIAGRRFSFLGFSHSSLRSHSAWFLAPFEDLFRGRQDYHSVLRRLGDFKDIRIPAKCAARIGQAFSETPYAVRVTDRKIEIRHIPDVKCPDGSRVFSDGVGTISRAALQEVWQALPRRLGAPTCIQIRLAGVKGMLSLDARLTGRVICIRPESMMKFPSKDVTELGICDVASKPLRLVLSRQLIKILEDMGTDDEWFFTEQNKALSLLRGVTETAANTSTFLEYQAIGSHISLPKLISRMDARNIDYREDTFLKSVVEHVVLRELRLLKHKARIPVEKGVTLFGVMDETGFLKEGEVYLHYDTRKPNHHHGIEGSLKDGQIIVTRSPALHPGDIQLAKMVTPPEGHALRDLRNCIVFSQRGNRDLPSQLSGGDLDGDLYNVIWDPAAKPKRMYLAADYPRVSPQPLDREVTRDDIAGFFINFMKSDVLGLIANRHQTYADIKENGTADIECVKLAELHSTAVDYSKTGIAVSLFDIPKQPRTRPDFTAPAPPVRLYDVGQVDYIEDAADDFGDDGFGRSKLRYHRSEKILGRLYRAVDEKNIWSQNVRVRTAGVESSVWSALLGIVQSRLESLEMTVEFEQRFDEARKLRDYYDTSVADKMWQFSDNIRVPLSETEVFCGSILNKSGSQTRRQRDSSIKLRDEMDRLMVWFVKLIRDPGVAEEEQELVVARIDDNTKCTMRKKAVEMCLACVVVGMTQDKAEKRRKEITPAIQSFKVVAACCLLNELDALAREVQAEA